MEISIFQVDAFTSRLFAGNPAAVCPLEAWLSDQTLQSIAAENNLAETAFFVRDSRSGEVHLRWFTPVCEVDLCGHATLASAYVLFRELGVTSPELHFQTKSGQLVVRRSDHQMMELDFPARPPEPATPHPDLLDALGGPAPIAVLAARDYLIRYRSAADVGSLRPNMAGLMNIDRFGVIVTAPGEDSDCVSRFFAPAKGVPEDPVTGSAHCTVVPYWAKELGKTTIHARQISPRGGELFCRLDGNRVRMKGNAVLFLKGTLYL